MFNIFGSFTAKIFGVSTLALALICGVIYFTMSNANGRLADKNSELASEVTILESALKQNKQALERTLEDRIRIEKVLTDKILQEQKIKKETDNKLKEASDKLARLRREYDELEKFFNVVVPDVFVDNFMFPEPKTNSDNEN